jgi:hypothetical protein
MLTEARKAFRQGFILDEQELRRLVDTAVEQVRKATQNEPVVLLQAKFRNGTVTECSAVEELLTLENVGPKQIVRLRLLVDDGGEAERIDPKVAILIRFTNLVAEDDEVRSISYTVKGEQRDWVLVTASELEDRIEKVKCIGGHALLETRRSVFSLVVPVIFIISMYGLMHATTSFPRASLVKDAIDSGHQLDAVKAVYLLEQDYLKDRELFPQGAFLRWALAYPILLMFGCYALVSLARYLHPSYVFSWADYIRVHQRRVSIRNYVYVGIVLALLVTVIGDIIIVKLGIK